MNRLKVISTTMVSVDAIEIGLRIPKKLRKKFKFQPGQYVTILLNIDGKSYSRSYSISKLLIDNVLSICVKRVPGGVVSTFLTTKTVIGDYILVDNPTGDFYLRKPFWKRSGDIIFLTGGSGITPMIPMIQRLIDSNHKGNIILINANKSNDSIIYPELISTFSEKVKVITVLEQNNTQEEDVQLGMLTQEVIKSILSELEINLKRATYYFSGPPKVIENADGAIKDLGVSDKRMFSEKFFLESKKYADGKKHRIRVRAEKAFNSVQVNEFTSILDASLESGKHLQYSCKAGQCKKCSCKLIRGSVNHAGEIVNKKKTILACQSFPLADDVIVDFHKSFLVKIFTNRNYLMMILFLTVISLLIGVRQLKGPQIIAYGPPNTGHENISCIACHRDEKGSVREQIQSNWKQNSHHNSALYFGKLPVTSDQCLDCHQRENDRHSIHRFNEPKYESARAKIHPENCISCHSEHQGKRVTITNTGFCINCHQNLSVKNDPVIPSHERLIKSNQWETCLQCHDYHGNHVRTTPHELKDTISRNSILEYFDGGKDPFSNKKKYKAIKK